MMKKKSQRILVTILVALIALSMLGSGFFAYFGGSVQNTNPNGSQSDGKQPAASEQVSQEEYQRQKSLVDSLSQQAKATPSNIDVQKRLGDAYFGLAVAATNVNPAEAQEDLGKAIEAYQAFLKVKKDINVLLDMANAAFYVNDYDLAEKSFQEVLAIEPNNYNGLYSYGLFLFEAKQDYAGAIEQWQKALAVNPNSPDAEQLKGLIADTQSKLANPQPAQKP